MSQLILYTGGSRSGKSRLALARANGLGGERVFVATCPVLDEEMRARVEAHRLERAGGGWTTVEAPTALAETLAGVPTQATVLVDCLTLWVNNLLWQVTEIGRDLDESTQAGHAREVLAAARARAGATLFVTNEVGSGIVPADATTRRFRDLAGRTNQEFAAGCDEVILAVCGYPVPVKIP
jgi:adenosylcobinamide kinase/adenosylcobinamide-phosphate guanylyltransferase